LKYADDKIDYILRGGNFVRSSAGSQGSIETNEGSKTLKDRARAIRDEFAQS
jgi:hypothetical protein